MDMLREALFCEPTVRGQIGAAVVQFLFWRHVTNYQTGLFGKLKAAVERQPWYRHVQDNYKEDDYQKMYKFEDPGFNYLEFLKTVLHHSVGGLLMLTGMMTGQAWIWRHGMLVQVGGMDLLDFYRMASCKLFPPGTFPTNHYMKSDKYRIFITFHHSVGLCVGVPVNLFFSEVHMFQLFGLVALGAPALSLIPSIYVKTLDLKGRKMLVLCNKIYVFVTFGIIQRTLFYIPVAIKCLAFAYRSPMFSWAFGVPFLWALLAMSAFNLACLQAMASGTYKMLTASSEEEKKEEATSVTFTRQGPTHQHRRRHQEDGGLPRRSLPGAAGPVLLRAQRDEAVKGGCTNPAAEPSSHKKRKQSRGSRKSLKGDGSALLLPCGTASELHTAASA
jgi:hypothetical protein